MALTFVYVPYLLDSGVPESLWVIRCRANMAYVRQSSTIFSMKRNPEPEPPKVRRLSIRPSPFCAEVHAGPSRFDPSNTVKAIFWPWLEQVKANVLIFHPSGPAVPLNPHPEYYRWCRTRRSRRSRWRGCWMRSSRPCAAMASLSPRRATPLSFPSPPATPQATPTPSTRDPQRSTLNLVNVEP